MLQSAHHVDSTDASLRDQKIHFVQSNAVFACASAAKAQGPAHKFVIQVFGNFALTWNFGVDQIAKVEVAITDVTHQKVGQATGLGFGHRVKQAVGQFANWHTGVGADGSATGPALQCRKISIVSGRPKARALFGGGGPFKRVATMVAGNFLNCFGLLLHASGRAMKLH